MQQGSSSGLHGRIRHHYGLRVLKDNRRSGRPRDRTEGNRPPLAGSGHARRVRVGAWRDDNGDPMQVVSGPMGKERVHFEAPVAKRLGPEMGSFLDWFNGNTEGDWVVKAGLAHLWFVTIHPFEDGNGRIARAIADLALARSEQSSQRFYSMSAQIRQERADYYDILERTQEATMDVKPWMDGFLGCLGRAIEGAQSILGTVLSKAHFWETFGDALLNERQRLVVNRLLDGFEGKLTSMRYGQLAKCSHDTALRDIAALVDRGILVRNPQGGRSTSYSLAD
ncbi:MAG: Fic family protein [Candidatus Sulfotelmatobacter sp.]